MCFRVETIAPIPQETVTIARSAFPKGSIVMSIRDELGFLYKDEQFRALFQSLRGQPASGCLEVSADHSNAVHRGLNRCSSSPSGARTNRLEICVKLTLSRPWHR